MKLTNFFTWFLPISFAGTLAGCSVNLTRGNLDGVPLTEEKYSFFGNIPMVYNGDTLQLSQNLLRAYTAAASPAIYPREHCRGTATINASVKQNSKGSALAIGAAFISLWPILPVNETWTYQLNVGVYCDGTLVKHIEFTEEDQVRATLYGKFRSDLLNKASEEMHRKLVQRLSYELGMNRPVDQNSVSDFSI
ncbi:MAG: hypothetical protein MJY85_01545 [Fibrobacter sp.]|nr:hypothetical protein [Fibrobacter sp.]